MRRTLRGTNLSKRQHSGIELAAIVDGCVFLLYGRGQTTRAEDMCISCALCVFVFCAWRLSCWPLMWPLAALAMALVAALWGASSEGGAP